MHSSIVLFTVLQVVIAVPLNINLGAYSPALVVGDGEISFGGGEAGGAARSAAQLMETLATGAVNSAAANQGPTGEAAPAVAETPATVAAPETAAPAPAAEGAAPPVAKIVEITPTQNISKKVLQPFTRREILERDIQGFRESLAFAKEAMKNTPAVELGTEAAGVGIKQSPGLNVPAGSPAAGTVVERRSEQRSEKAGITLLAIAEI